MAQHKSILLAFALALPTLLGSCAVGAVGATAFALSEEFKTHSVAVVIEEDTDYAWKSALNSLSQMTPDLVHRDDAHLAAKAYVDNATVTVQVAQYKAGETSIRVAARQLMAYDDEISRFVLDKILLDMRK